MPDAAPITRDEKYRCDNCGNAFDLFRARIRGRADLWLKCSRCKHLTLVSKECLGVAEAPGSPRRRGDAGGGEN